MSSEEARDYTKFGGPHIGVVRSWMQRKFRNGERVTWGSNEYLTGTDLTPAIMEQLATEIAEVVFDDVTIGAARHRVSAIRKDNK